MRGGALGHILVTLKPLGTFVSIMMDPNSLAVHMIDTLNYGTLKQVISHDLSCQYCIALIVAIL